jgi:hypothetical protein
MLLYRGYKIKALLFIHSFIRVCFVNQGMNESVYSQIPLASCFRFAIFSVSARECKSDVVREWWSRMVVQNKVLNLFNQVQMLHCIDQTPSSGGHNQFVDGFQVALQLRQRHPDYFRLLTSVVVDFYDVGTDFVPFDHRSKHRTIE